MKTIVSPQVETALAVAYNNHWRFDVLEDRGPVFEPVWKDGWWTQSTDRVPRDIAGIIKKLEAAGVEIQQILISHEAPKLLPPPKREPLAFPKPKIDWEKVGHDTGETLVVVGKGVGTVVKYAAIGIGYLMMGILALPLLLIMADPAVDVVLSDGSRIRLATWEE